MRLLRRVAMMSMAVCLPVVAQAQETTIKGIYLGSPELCAQAKKDTLQTVIEAGNVVLSNRGIEATEFNCAFLQFVKNPRMPAGWVAVSMCEEPGYAYPDMFSIVERQAGELEVAALTELSGEAMDAGPLPEEAPAENGAQQSPPTTQPEPPSPPPAAEAPEAQDSGDGETEAAGLSGTYYLCQGITLP